MSRRGFTLLELMLAITILAGMAGAVFYVVQSTYQAHGRISEITRRTEALPAVLVLMRRDLEAAFDPGGDISYFVGARTEANFLSSAPSFDGEEYHNVTEIGYRVEGPVLMRREQPFVDEEPTEGGRWTEVYDRVRRLELAYSGDGTDWEDLWESQEAGLPKFIRVRIEVETTAPDADETETMAWELVVQPRP